MKFLHLGDLHIGKRLNNISLLESTSSTFWTKFWISPGRSGRMPCSLLAMSTTAPCRQPRR